MSLLMTVMFMLFYVYLFAKGSETQRPTLTATGISKDQTITLTCNIHEGTARSVGWYRNQGRKVISIGYVNDSCETSPPELPFSAKCMCLNITVYTCTLTVDPSMHDGDEWECSFADNGLSIKSNGLRIGGSNVSRTETEENRCFVETDKDSVAAKSLIMDKNDTINVQVNGTFVASCNHRNRTAELSEPEFKELFGISITPRGWCIFTVFNLTGTQHRINISSTSALKEVFIEHKAYPECMGPSNLDFTLKGKEGHTQEKEGHELEKEKNCSILSWLVGFFVLLPLGSGIGIAITCLFFKKDVCNVQRRILKGTQTPHAGESEGQETPDEERELTEQNPESNGEIHVGQNGGAQASHRGDTGPWARFVEYLRTCFHRNQ